MIDYILQWFKRNTTVLFIVLVTGGFLVYIYGCPPTVTSLIDSKTPVTRQELQLELDTLIHTAGLRMASLEQQEQFRAIILQNALVLVQGQPFNPVGLITAVAALYGIKQGGCNVVKVVKNIKGKGKNNNG